MYLTIHQPHQLRMISSYGVGLSVVQVENEDCLVVKATKEVILTAKMNMGFAFFLVPVVHESIASFVLYTAFYDDQEEPIVIKSPLPDESATHDLLRLFSKDEFSACFFDENNRELLSYKVRGDLGQMRKNMSEMKFIGVEHSRELLSQSDAAFSMNIITQELEKYSVELTECLFPDDIFIMDMDPVKHSFTGLAPFSSSTLIRPEPGAGQELDIVFLLQRVFDPSQIYLNPHKKVDSEEMTDVLVVGEETVYIIQAKDSPNTEAMLRNSLSRKKTKSIEKLKGAARQLKAAVAFAKKDPVLRFIYDGKDVDVEITGKRIIGMMIVKELFNDSFKEYSAVNYKLIEEARVPSVFYDFSEFSLMTLYCPSEEIFLEAIHQVYSFGMDHEEFPRLRYSGKPPAPRIEI